MIRACHAIVPGRSDCHLCSFSDHFRSVFVGLLDSMSPVPHSPSSFSHAGPQLEALDRSVPRWTPTRGLNCKILQALDRSLPRRTRTASSGSKCLTPDLNCKRYRSQCSLRFPAGLGQQPLEQSVPHRASTASARSQCSPPYLDSNLWIRVFLPGT